MSLDPQAFAFLRQLAAQQVPEFHQLTPAEARVLASSTPPGIQQVEKIEDRMVPGPAGPIPVRIYTPLGYAEQPRPIVVYFHGGGWVVGSLDSYDGLTRRLANASGSLVVTVDYRLAPEHKYPAALEDCHAAAVWAAEQGASFGGDGGRIVVAGDSAGGQLAAAVCLRARDQGSWMPAYQVLLYPIMNHAFTTSSYQEFAEGYFLSKATMMWFWNHYLSHPGEGDQPYASPLRADNLAQLAPAYVLTAEYDPLRDEGRAYAKRLREAGVPVQLHQCQGALHGFLRRPDVFDAAGHVLVEIGRAIRGQFA